MECRECKKRYKTKVLDFLGEKALTEGPREPFGDEDEAETLFLLALASIKLQDTTTKGASSTKGVTADGSGQTGSGPFVAVGDEELADASGAGDEEGRFSLPQFPIMLDLPLPDVPPPPDMFDLPDLPLVIPTGDQAKEEQPGITLDLPDQPFVTIGGQEKAEQPDPFEEFDKALRESYFQQQETPRGP